MFKIRFFAIFCLLQTLFAAGIFAQSADSFVQQVPQMLSGYVTDSRNEKLYLHIDKESCLPGDTLFFKGYLVSAVTNQLVDFSRYIYVELVDRKDLVYIREKVTKDTINNAFIGYLPMSDNLRQGEYFIRAYTYNMQNDKEDYIYRKRIRVISPYDNRIKCNIDVEPRGGGKRTLKLTFLNAQNERYDNVVFQYKIPGETPDTLLGIGNTGYNGLCRIDVNDPASDHIWISFDNNGAWAYQEYLPIPGAKRDFDVQLFPEGGSLLSGVPQRVAFKSVGRDGLSIPVSGKVYDDNGILLTTFSSNQLGMGGFNVNTQVNATYTVECTDSLGTVKRFPLNVDNKAQYALQLKSDMESVSYNVLRSTTSAQASLSDKYVLIHSRGITLALFPAEQMCDRVMNLNTAPEGIIHFALIDEKGQTYSERLWFHRKSVRSSVKVESFKDNVRPRSNAKIEISLLTDDAENIENQTEGGNFSVSVTHNGQMDYDESLGGIEGNLLLTSDLEGYVESPGYYFSGDYSLKQHDMDVLMLTQGWRRFKLGDVLQGVPAKPKYYYLERGQFLSGHVKNYWGKKSLNSDIILIGTNGIARKLQIDSTGHFVENDIWFDIGTRFIVQALRKDGKDNLELELDDQEFRDSRNIEPLSLCLGDNAFYERYGKDYVFADNGERIQTLGEVRVQGGAAYLKQEILKDALQKEIRINHLMGATSDMAGYGMHPGAMVMARTKDPITKVAYASKGFVPYRDVIYRNRSHDYSMHYISTGGVAYRRLEFDIRDLQHVDDETIAAYNAIDDKNKISNGEAVSTLVYRDNDNTTPRLIGVQVRHPFSLIDPISFDNFDIGGVQTVPIYDYITAVTNYDVQFNMQTIVPFAPQQHVEFYKPSYDVATELLKDPVDEKITRYWNPNVKLSDGKTFEFEFPTAQGEGSDSYTIVVEGFSENGTPIHKSWRYDVR